MKSIQKFLNWQKRNIEPDKNNYSIIEHAMYSLLSLFVVAVLMFGSMKFFQIAFVHMSERWQEISKSQDKAKSNQEPIKKVGEIN